MLNFKVKQNLKNLHETSPNIAILKRNNVNLVKSLKCNNLYGVGDLQSYSSW